MLQAETCLNEMNVNLKHFTNAAMTNRKLIISSTGSVFPDHYLIRFEPATFSPLWVNISSGKIILEYGILTKTWVDIFDYQTINLNSCKKENIRFDFASGTVAQGIIPGTLRMNKGFRQLKPDELSTFSYQSSGSNTPIFVAEIQVNACLSDEACCLDGTCAKEFFKRTIDSRAQGIFTTKCKFYSQADPFKCETREDEQPTID